VDVRSEVRQAMCGPARSHRSAEFQDDFQWTKKRLCELTGAVHAQILLGSGTLANDAVAAQLALTPSRGLILTNGEFGDRLVDHASRLGLEFETIAADWGGVFEAKDIEHVLNRNPDIRWVWAVHCETSTGVLNDMEDLKSLCAPRGVRLCLDCTSSIGTVALNLAGVHLATGVSGKGLGAFPGLSMVFHHHEINPSPKSIPRYLDIGLYASCAGIPFTHSSNLLAALQAAVRDFQPDERFAKLASLSKWVRLKLRAAGMRIVAPDAHAAPAVVSIVLPRETDSRRLGDLLRERGFQLSFESEYLLKRNWIQICLMGRSSRETLRPLFEILLPQQNLWVASGSGRFPSL
jgi:aspartate aminotransferase-like enzyme